jgi:hypothetical protein
MVCRHVTVIASDRQQIASQWGLQLIFRMHNSNPTPQGVENRNILLWFKCVLTALFPVVFQEI